MQFVTSDILLVHSENDGTITHTHSRALFDKLIQSGGESNLVKTMTVGSATMRTFQRSNQAGSSRIVHLQMKYGGHDTVGRAETTLRVLHQLLYDEHI